MTETMTIAPVRKSVQVACSVELAFEVFTRETESWWPTETHAVYAGRVQQLVWEEHEGGTVYEVSTGGETALWGTVLAWEPPHRLVLSWEVVPGRAPTELEVRFSSAGEGTRVDLEHRHWERLGAEGMNVRDTYETGWDTVLGPYASRLA